LSHNRTSEDLHPRGADALKVTELQVKRKIGRCAICHLYWSLCICHAIPRIEIRTRLCPVIHAKELRRSSNTGRLAIGALVNSEMRIRGQAKQPLDLNDLLVSPYRTLLFYPSHDAVELNTAFVAQDPRPIQLIVPDGTWRQASKISFRHRELQDVPRVMISTPNSSQFHLRAQHRAEGMATLQAIAHALGVIEGDFVKAQLMRLYNIKLEQTLLNRGLFTEAKSLLSV
jgi:DTW domain-containing protein